MKSLSWKAYSLIFIYFLITSLIFFKGINIQFDIQRLTLFTNDSSAITRTNSYISSDSEGNIIVTRFFHNKVLAGFETFFISIARSIDLVFLFNLSGFSSMYDDTGKVNMLLPIEFPLFLFSVFYIIKNPSITKKYKFILPLLIFSLIINGLLSPALDPVKLFPYVLLLRFIIFIGIYEFIRQVLSPRRRGSN